MSGLPGAASFLPRRSSAATGRGRRYIEGTAILNYLRTLVHQHRQSAREAERIAYTQDWAAFHESLQIAYDKRAPAADRDHHRRVARLAISKRRDIELAADSACRRETLDRWRNRPDSLIP